MELTIEARELIQAFNLSLIELQYFTQEEVPIGETGDLNRSINISNVTQSKSELSGYIFIDPSAFRSTDQNYGIYVHEGTGIYGKHNRPIVPTTKKALAWGLNMGGGKMQFVFASVKGQKPNPFFERTIENYNEVKQDKIANIFYQAINRNLKITGSHNGEKA